MNIKTRARRSIGIEANTETVAPYQTPSNCKVVTDWCKSADQGWQEPMAIRSSSDEKKAMTSVSTLNQTATGTGPEPPASKTSARVAYFRYFGGRTLTVLGPVSGQCITS